MTVRPRTLRSRSPTHLPPPRLSRNLIAAGATVLLAGVAVAFGTSTLEVYRLQREAANLERTKHQLQEQNAQLHEEIRLLYTPAYIERIAREQLGLVKPGEIALLIVRPPAPPRVAPASPPERTSWVGRLWDILTGILSH